MPIMDRERFWDLDDGVRAFYQRTSTYPVEYAITLRVLRDGRWRTIHLFDNAHGVDEHHEHSYVDSCKQPPLVRDCDTNTAMAVALETLFTTWPQILDTWEHTR
ncbi:MAG: hypothetical protein ACJ76L_07995 [Conexibacter sp.]